MTNRTGATGRWGRAAKLVPVLLLAFLTAACQNIGPKAAGGAALGAAGGGLLGAAAGGGTTGILAGVFLGGLLGGALGDKLDQNDREYADRVAQRSLETSRVGQASTWRNPDSGNYGSMTPTRTYQGDYGQHCREFQQTVTVGGQTEEAYGTACRQADGSWQITQ